MILPNKSLVSKGSLYCLGRLLLMGGSYDAELRMSSSWNILGNRKSPDPHLGDD